MTVSFFSTVATLGKGQSSVETYFALALSNNEYIYIIVMMSLYLLTGCLPKFKVAIIKPLLKPFCRVAVKHGADMII